MFSDAGALPARSSVPGESVRGPARHNCNWSSSGRTCWIKDRKLINVFCLPGVCSFTYHCHFVTHGTDM